MCPVLAGRPVRYGFGPDLPVGTYQPVQTIDGWTIERRVGFTRWYMLERRESPAWRTWPTYEACMAANYEAPRPADAEGFHDGGYTCADWPHWGSET